MPAAGCERPGSVAGPLGPALPRRMPHPSWTRSFPAPAVHVRRCPVAKFDQLRLDGYWYILYPVSWNQLLFTNYVGSRLQGNSSVQLAPSSSLLWLLRSQVDWMSHSFTVFTVGHASYPAAAASQQAISNSRSCLLKWWVFVSARPKS